MHHIETIRAYIKARKKHGQREWRYVGVGYDYLRNAIDAAMLDHGKLKPGNT